MLNPACGAYSNTLLQAADVIEKRQETLGQIWDVCYDRRGGCAVW